MNKSTAITRRRFLHTSAAVAAPLVLGTPKWALGQNAAPASASDQITVGIIGTGKRAGSLMRAYFARDPQFRTLAVCDVDTTRRNHSADFINRAYGNSDCARYNDYRELLQRDDIDAVVIATQDSWHANIIIDAAVAGKDIYSEKPLTLNLHESQKVVEAVRKHKRVLQTGSQQRTEYGGKFVKACEYVRSGRIGKLTHVHVWGCPLSPIPCDLPGEEMEPGLDWDRWLGPAPMRDYNSILSPRGVHNHFPLWRNYREYAGGSLADIGAHHFDIAHWGMGVDGSGPVSITPPEDPEATFGSVAVYADGVRVIHAPERDGITFVGTEGKIYVDRSVLQADPANLFETPLTDDDVHLSRPVNQAQDWANCIRSRKDPICSVEVGAGSAAICHLMNMSYRLRRELKWDAKAWRFTNDDEANRLRDYDRRAGYELPTF